VPQTQVWQGLSLLLHKKNINIVRNLVVYTHTHTHTHTENIYKSINIK